MTRSPNAPSSALAPFGAPDRGSDGQRRVDAMGTLTARRRPLHRGRSSTPRAAGIPVIDVVEAFARTIPSRYSTPRDWSHLTPGAIAWWPRWCSAVSGRTAARRALTLRQVPALPRRAFVQSPRPPAENATTARPLAPRADRQPDWSSRRTSGPSSRAALSTRTRVARCTGVKSRDSSDRGSTVVVIAYQKSAAGVDATAFEAAQSLARPVPCQARSARSLRAGCRSLPRSRSPWSKRSTARKRCSPRTNHSKRARSRDRRPMPGCASKSPVNTQ